jgi:hypothetical protein
MRLEFHSGNAQDRPEGLILREKQTIWLPPCYGSSEPTADV